MNEKELILKSKEEAIISEELTVEEVNVYGMDCGEPRIGCFVDCPDLTPWITSLW